MRARIHRQMAESSSRIKVTQILAETECAGRAGEEPLESFLGKNAGRPPPAENPCFLPALTRQPSSLASRGAQIDRIRAVMGAPSGKVPCLIVTGQAATGKTGLLRDAMAAAGRESDQALDNTPEASSPSPSPRHSSSRAHAAIALPRCCRGRATLSTLNNSLCPFKLVHTPSLKLGSYQD